LWQQRKPEDAEPTEDGADEAKKAKPSEETNGEGEETNATEAETDEQPQVCNNILCWSWNSWLLIIYVCLGKTTSDSLTGN